MENWKSWIDQLDEEKLYLPPENNKKWLAQDRQIAQFNSKILSSEAGKNVLRWAKENWLGIYKIFLIKDLGEFVAHANTLIQWNYFRRSSYLDKEFLSQFWDIVVKSSKTESGLRKFDIVDFFNLLAEIKRSIDEAGLKNALYQNKNIFYVKPFKNTVFAEISFTQRQEFIELVAQLISQYISEALNKKVEVNFEKQTWRNLDFKINFWN